MEKQIYIFHVDLDAFFVSVERVLDPKLIGKPVIIGGEPTSRGVVAAASYEARKFGIHSAMPLYQAYNLCRNAIFLHGHHDKYIEYSRSIKEILRRYAPRVEMSSIDEAYLDMTGCERLYGNMVSFAWFLQKTIREELSLPISIGVGSNKMIAKVASDAAKPEGILIVTHGYEKEFLSPLYVEVLPGVGKITLGLLHDYGIHSVGQMAMFDKIILRELFGVSGEMLFEYAHGIGEQNFYEGRKRKSISKSMTFSKDLADKNLVERYLLSLIEGICFSMRDEKIKGRTISVRVRYSDFKEVQRARTILFPTNDDIIIFSIASELFRNAVTRRISIRLVGVEISNLSEDITQEEIFNHKENKWERILACEQKLRVKYGKGIIGFATAYRMKRKTDQDTPKRTVIESIAA
jgi:DNA polymerase-4